MPEPESTQMEDSSADEQLLEGAEDTGDQDEGDYQSPGEGEHDAIARVNLKDIPDEARPHVEKVYRQLQADYTRKTQALARERKEARDLIESARENAETVRLAQEVLDSPELQAYLSNREASGDGSPEGGMEFTEAFTSPEAAKAVETTMSRRIDAALEPVVKELGRVSSVIFAATHRDWAKYQDKMREIIKKEPGTSLERAYKLAKADDTSLDTENAGLKSRIAKLESQLKKQGSVETPKTPKPGKAAPAVTSIEDAFGAALETLGEPTDWK